MDLNKLFEIFAEKNLSYVDVSVRKGFFRAFASTGYNGRGIKVEITKIETDEKIEVRLMQRIGEPLEQKVTEQEAFELIKNFETKEK